MKMIKLYNGNCLEIMKTIPSESIDAIITDPPYGKTACKWDSVIPFDLMWKQLNRIIKDNGAIVLTASQPFTSALIMSNPKMFRYEWIWEKSKASNFFKARKQPLKSHENILVFYKKLPMYNPQKTKGKPYYRGGIKEHNVEIETINKIPNYFTHERKSEDGNRFPRSVQYFKTAEFEGKLHPTQKPIKLMEYLIETYTSKNDTVLDNAMGSGTTGVACINTNRKFIGMELDESYFTVAKDRINNSL